MQLNTKKEVLEINYLSSDINTTSLERTEEILSGILGKSAFKFSQNSAVLFIATGGTERKAIRLTENHRCFILMAHREQNSWAAAMEIAAYLRSQDKKVLLVDALAENALYELDMALLLKKAYEFLQNAQVAVIGEVSEWLIQSEISKEILFNKLGVSLQIIHWDKIAHFSSYSVNNSFLESFPEQERSRLSETSRVFNQLEHVINDYELDAISVECFSLVQKDSVTACLPLAVLNSKGKVAACEGDIVSMIGKLLIKAVTGIIPWQANIAELKPNEVLFAHCTAPLNLLGEYDITTHFETGKGTAIRGKIKDEALAVFRLDNRLEKFMLLEGKAIATPSHSFACRTQLILELSDSDSQLLKQHALGNHHLLFPLKEAEIVRKFMKLLGMQEIK